MLEGINEKEFYEVEDKDDIDNFDKLNEKYRNNFDWVVIII
jgi:hypothetical protein